MKITARGIGAYMPLLLGLALVSPASAQSAAKSLKQQIVGHWQLVSVTVNSWNALRRSAARFDVS